MIKTAFVTGANGFLGINLIEELSKENWNIITYSLPGSDYTYLSRFQVTNIEGNLNNFKLLLKSIPSNVDAIFHIAGNTSMWDKNKKQQYDDNVIGTKNMVNAALLKKAKKFIYTSSISSYGYHQHSVVESTKSNALDCKMEYNISKFWAEEEIKRGIKKGLFAVIINPINIIGPYDINNWTRQFIKPVYYDKLPAVPPGNAMWCHVKDVANAHIQAVDLGRNGENYLLGGVEASFKDVINEVQKQLGKRLSTHVQPKFILKILSILMTWKSKFDNKEPILTYAKYKRAVGNITCDYSKAKKELHYKTSSLEEMIKDTYDWLVRENLL